MELVQENQHKMRNALTSIAKEIQRFEESKLKREASEEAGDNENILSELSRCKSKVQSKRARICKLENNLKTACFVVKQLASAKEDQSVSLNNCLSSTRSEYADLIKKCISNDNINKNLTIDNEKLHRKLYSVTSVISLGYRELQKIKQEPLEKGSVLSQLRKLIMSCGEYYADYCNEHEKYLQMRRRCNFVESKMRILENHIEAMTEQNNALKYSNAKLLKENKVLKNRCSENFIRINNVQVERSKIKMTGVRKAILDSSEYTPSNDYNEFHHSFDFSSHLLIVKKLLSDQDTLLRDLKFITKEFSIV